MTPKNKEKLVIIDSNALLYRAFHALPPLSNEKGNQTGAVYGFLLTFFSAIKDLGPNYIAACFDFPAPTFRHKQFKDYKAQRPEMPGALSAQIPKAKEILKSIEVPIFEKKGFEADDLIATISTLVKDNNKKSFLETFIVTGDLDLLQLVDNTTKVYTLGRGIKQTVVYDKEKVISRFGVPPEDLIDLKALAGDPSDNIPGVKGIGQKTAARLLKKFDTLEDIYKNLQDTTQIKERIKKKLIDNKQKAFLSQKLVEVKKDVPIDFNLQECQFKGVETEKTKNTLEQFGFSSLVKRLSKINSSYQQKLIKN